jgi:hypothetical protein
VNVPAENLSSAGARAVELAPTPMQMYGNLLSFAAVVMKFSK